MTTSNTTVTDHVDDVAEGNVTVHPDFDFWDGNVAALLGRRTEDFDSWLDADDGTGDGEF